MEKVKKFQIVDDEGVITNGFRDYESALGYLENELYKDDDFEQSGEIRIEQVKHNE